MESKKLPASAKLYVGGVIVAGFAVTAHAGFSLAARPVPNEWLVLAALTLLTGSFTVKVPSLAARISISDAFVFSSVLLFGPAPATIIVALDSFFISLWMRSDGRLTARSLFNLAAVAIAIWTASHTFYFITGTIPGDVSALLPLERRLWALFTLAAMYFLVNSWLVATALAFERRMPIATMWWNNFTWLSLNYFAGISAAALLVSYSPQVDIRAIAIIIPLLLVSYLTYRTSLARIDDAKHHVHKLNALYMSTIEALALAVDAKDQITHGHIRRVQMHAVELARRLGVSNENHLKAIEAAALLHDMGKLAIPEHILNKPGRLTAAEFETMKEHASIGADLLSSVDFPYPVVPIVRHHHENWNGTGYPSGLSGPDIPIGARILAVVDCFDALTSDRPYRPQLSTDAAFGILLERRGTMYDPLIVDTFIDAYDDIADTTDSMRTESLLETPSANPKALSSRPETTPRTTMASISTDTCTNGTSDELIQLLADEARASTDATVVAIYIYLPDFDVLRCMHVSGTGADQLTGLAIMRGERISGWVAANTTSMVNAHAALDLGEISQGFHPPLVSAVSVPLMSGRRLLGVVTCYSHVPDAFNERHRQKLDDLCRALNACRHETPCLAGPATVKALPAWR